MNETFSVSTRSDDPVIRPTDDQKRSNNIWSIPPGIHENILRVGRRFIINNNNHSNNDNNNNNHSNNAIAGTVNDNNNVCGCDKFRLDMPDIWRQNF